LGNRLLTTALAMGVCFFLLLALYLAGRRLTGALTEPLPLPASAATALIALTWVWFTNTTLWKLHDSHSRFTSRVQEQLICWVPPVTLVLLAVACSNTSTRIRDALVWLPAIGAAFFFTFRKLPARGRHSSIGKNRPALDEFGRAGPQQHVLQQLIRSRAADGSESIRATLTAEFPPGERDATLYVAFCPPFERLPHVDIECGDSAASAKLTQLLHHGAQLDIRLPRSAERRTAFNVDLVAVDAAAE
jgi:hypothetical protein